MTILQVLTAEGNHVTIHTLVCTTRGDTPTCCHEWGVGVCVAQTPWWGRRGYLALIGWGGTSGHVSGGCHPVVVERFLKIDVLREKMSGVNGFEGGGRGVTLIPPTLWKKIRGMGGAMGVGGSHSGNSWGWSHGNPLPLFFQDY
jgi:hypothetical protein